MPALGAWAGFTGTTVDAEQFAAKLVGEGSLVNSFAILNGQIDTANWSAGDETIPTWAIQYGSFAAGAYFGFDRWEFTYARQTSGPNEAFYALHAGYTTRWFIPFDARIIFYGYQGFFRQDATVWSSGAGIKEDWQLKFQFDGSLQNDSRVSLPHGRDSTAAPSGADPGTPDENRWRYAAVTGVLMNATSLDTPTKTKGYRSLKVRVGGTVSAPDQTKAKLLTPSGGIWLLAIR